MAIARAFLLVAFILGAPALAQESDGSSNGGSDRFVNESTGTASFAIPIPAPRGTGGFQPQLAVAYSSAGGDGPFGVGWQLSLGQLRRSLRFGVPAYDASDRFELDGELLVEDAANPGTYRLATETWNRITRDTSGGLDQWMVESPNGTVIRYGTTAGSQIRLGGTTSPQSDQGPVSVWLPSEMEDPHGNVVKIAYDRSIDPGTGYPAAVTYSYRGGALVGGIERRVEFLLEDREDPLHRYPGGVDTWTTKRVSEIRSTVDGAPFRRLMLSYAPAGTYSTDRSRLVASQLFGDDCPLGVDPTTQCAGLPQQTYEYGDALADVTGSAWGSDLPYQGPELTGSGGSDHGYRFADLNGDGHLDAIQSKWGPGLSPSLRVDLGDGSGTFPNRSTLWESRFDAIDLTHYFLEFWSDPGSNANCAWAVTEVPETVPSSDPGDPPQETNLVTPRFVVTPDSPTESGELDPDWFVHSNMGIRPPTSAQLIDLNDDGLADVVISWELGAGYIEPGVAECAWTAQRGAIAPSHAMKGVWLNTGSGWAFDAALSTTLPVMSSTFSEATIRDPFDPNGFGSWVALPSQVVSEEGSLDTVVRFHVDDHGVRFAELNGDGRPDLIAGRESGHNRTFETTAWLNTESGWVEAPQWAPPVPFVAEHILRNAGGYAPTTGADTGLRLVDLNGDGLTDLLKTALPASHTTQSASFNVEGAWLNTGSGWCGVAEGCSDVARYLLPTGTTFSRELEQRAFDSGQNSGQPDDAWAVVGTGVRLVDLNADGHPELVRADDAAGAFGAWLHDPGAAASVWRAESRLAPSWPMTFLTKFDLIGGPDPVGDAGGRLFDLDDDGIPEFVRSGWSSWPAVWQPALDFSDRIVAHENGRGARVELAYLSDVAQRDPALEMEASADAVQLGEDPGADRVRWSRRPVVSERTLSGLDLAPVTHTFAYAHPRFCPLHRAALGFRIFESINDQDTARVQVRFWQDHGRAGQRSLFELYENGSLLRSSDAMWTVLDGSQVPGSLPGVNVGRITAQSSQGFGPSGEPGARHEVAYVYDDVHGYNYIEDIAITRPSGGYTVHREPVEPPDLVNWIHGITDNEEWVAEDGTVLRRERYLHLAGTTRVTQIERDVQLREPGASFEDTAVTQRMFDSYGNLVALIDPEQRARYFCYDGDHGNPSCPLPPSGSTDATHSVVTAMIDPLGETTSVNADLASGKVELVQRYNDDLAWVVVDGFGRPVESWVQPVSQAQGTQLSSTFYEDGTANPAGQPFEEVLSEVGDGTTIREARYFDALGREVRSVFPTPSGFAGRLVTRDHRGRPIASTPDVDCGVDPHCLITPPAGVETIAVYDALDRLISTDSPAAGLTTNEFTSASRTSPTTGMTDDYDLVKTTHADNRVSWRLTDGDRLVFQEECGFSTGCSSPETTFYEYLGTGGVETIWNAREDYLGDDNRLHYVYDTLGRVREIDDPDGGVTTQTYDLVGNLDTVQNARGGISDYDFDALDRLTQVDRPGSESTVTIVYDPHTRRKGITYAGSDVVTVHAYDDFGRENRKVVSTQGVTLITDFEYDLLGRTTRVVYPDYTAMNYAYEGAYLESVCGADGVCESNRIWVSDVTYDAVGREATLVDRHGTRSLEYDPTSYLLERSRFQETGSGEYWLDLSFDYDAAGRVSSITDAHNGPGTDGIDASASYTYDDHGRLESWTWGGATKWFKYDEIGNLTGRSLLSASDPPNQIYDDPARPHAIQNRTVGAGKSYDYDADGNMIRRGGQHLSYDSANRLVCVGSSPGACDVASFGYDALGNRAYEIAGQTRLFVENLFVWNSSNNQAIAHIFANGRQIGEQTRDGGELRTGWFPVGWEPPVDPGGLLWGLGVAAALALLVLAAWSGALGAIAERPVATTLALATALVVLTPPPALAGGGSGTLTRRTTHEDHLGSRVLLVSDTPDVVYRRVFEPFGEVVAESLGTEGQTRYLSGKRESVATRDGSASGLIDFGARWYDPEIGRFASIDPIVQDLDDPATHNPYSFVGNDPVNRVDPDGRGWGDALLNVVGLLVIIVGVALTYAGWESGPFLIGYGLGLIGGTISDRRTRAVFSGLSIVVGYGLTKAAGQAGSSNRSPSSPAGGDAEASSTPVRIGVDRGTQTSMDQAGGGQPAGQGRRDGYVTEHIARVDAELAALEQLISEADKQIEANEKLIEELEAKQQEKLDAMDDVPALSEFFTGYGIGLMRSKGIPAVDTYRGGLHRWARLIASNIAALEEANRVLTEARDRAITRRDELEAFKGRVCGFYYGACD